MALKQDQYTCLFTTHHPDHARRVADRVVMLQQGAILRDGSATETVTPDNVATLYGLEPCTEHHHTQGERPCCH
jgi:iron complex transport system ATP-binding protein